MTVKESIHIYEKVTVFIRDNKGHVTERVIKTPWFEKSLWDKFLTVIGFKKEPGTLLSDGFTALAKLYGGYSTGTTHAAIGMVASNCSGTFLYKVVTKTWSSPTLTITNATEPWDTTGSYTMIYLVDSASPRWYHSLYIGAAEGNAVVIGSGCAWWVEIKLSFSGS